MPAKKTAKPFTLASNALTIQAATGDGATKKLATFAGNAYTGEVMRPGGWSDMIVDLDGVEIPAQQRPALRQHDHEQIVGHTTSVTVTPEGIQIAGVFSGQPEHVDKVVTPARNGFAWQLSIGADPVSTEYLDAGQEAVVNGRTAYGPIAIARRTILGEISFVPLGADGNTSATVTASRRKAGVMFAKLALKQARRDGIKAAMKFSDDEIDAMSDDEAKAALKECMKADGDADQEPKDGDKDGAKAADDDSDNDTDKDKTAQAASVKNSIQAARDAHAKEERRIASVRAAAAKYNTVDTVVIGGKRVNLVAHAIQNGWNADTTELHALRASRPSAGVGNGPIAYSTSPAQLTDAVLECAVMQAAGREFKLDDPAFYGDTPQRGSRIDAKTQRKIEAELKQRYPDQVQQTARDLFKERAGLQQILVASARANGYRGGDMIRDDGDLMNVMRASNWSASGGSPIQADGTSTSSIANVLANVLNKFLLQGYMFVEQSWKDITGIQSVKDFKPTKKINLFGDFIFEQVADGGEIRNANLQDQAFANQADQYGKIMTIGRKQIINDDLGALTTVPMLMGRGAGLKLNQLFWKTWLDTTQKDDGGSTAFWAATHTIPNQQANSNYISGGTSALSATSLQTAQQTYDKQVDPNGYPLGIDAEMLLYPVELESTAWSLLNSTNIVYAGGTSSNATLPAENKWKNRYKPVKSRYLSNASFTGNSATAWWLLANPALLPVIEACFLGGQEAPTVQQAGPEYQFNVLGISIRGVFDFGIAMQNFRGGIKSAGA